MASEKITKMKAVSQEAAALNPTWQQTMIRVRDPKVSIPFYEENFGMTLLGEMHFGEGQGDFSVFFLGALTEQEKKGLSENGQENIFNARKGQCHLELTWNHGTEKLADEDCKVTDDAGRPQVYASGNTEPRGFGHIAFNVKDVYAASEQLEAKGVKFKKRPDEGRMKGLAFCLDPDGYWIEIVQGSQTIEPERFNFSQTMIRVKDPVETVAFYQNLFDMQVVSERHFEPERGDFSLFFLTTKTEQVKTLIDQDPAAVTKLMWDPALELTHNHGTETQEGPVYHNGNDTSFGDREAGSVPRGFGHIGFLVDDLEKFCALLETAEVTFLKRPSDGRMRNLAFVKDPTGYWIEIIERGAKF